MLQNKKSGIDRILEQDKLPKLLGVFFFLLVWYLSAMCEARESFDLQRYYEKALFSKNDSLSDILEYATGRGVDFIYYVILHWAVVLEIPLNIVTALTVTISYGLVVSCMKEIYRGRMPSVVLFVVLFLTPITWVIAIPRNTMALTFLFIALVFFYRKKWILMSLFIVVGVLTHFSSLMYVAVFIVCYLIRNVKVNIGVIFVSVAVFFIVSILVPSYLIDIITYAISGGDNVYANDYTDMEVRGLDSYTNIGRGDSIPILYSLIYSVILLLVNKKQGYEFWVLFITTLMLAFFINSNLMLTNRCMMTMRLFWALNVASIYSSSYKDEKNIVFIVSFVGLIPVLWHFIAYRSMYLPFLFE